jgi:hypothetical protein
LAEQYSDADWIAALERSRQAILETERERQRLHVECTKRGSALLVAINRLTAAIKERK